MTAWVSGYAVHMELERQQYLNDCGVEPIDIPWSTFIVARRPLAELIEEMGRNPAEVAQGRAIARLRDSLWYKQWLCEVELRRAAASEPVDVLNDWPLWLPRLRRLNGVWRFDWGVCMGASESLSMALRMWWLVRYR